MSRNRYLTGPGPRLLVVAAVVLLIVAWIKLDLPGHDAVRSSSRWLLLVAAVVSVWLGQRRRRQFEAFARRMGWTWDRDPKGPGPAAGLALHPFAGAEQGHAINVLAGGFEGRHVAVFEHTQVRRTAKGRTADLMTCYRVGLPGTVPWFELHPRPAPAGPPEGPGDLELGDLAFDRAYLVRTHDPDGVRALLSPDVVELLVAAPPLTVAAQGTVLTAVEPGRLREPSLALGPLRALAALAARVPASTPTGPPPG